MRINESTFYSYIPGPLIKDLLSNDTCLDILMEYLKVPGKSLAQLKRLAPTEKMRAIEEQIAHLQRTKTSIWYEVAEAEIIAGSMFHCLPKKVMASVFGMVKQERDLVAPVAEWLRQQKDFRPFAEIPMGTKRIDVLGFRKGGFFSSDHVVAIELKNDLKQFERGLDQMTTYCDYAHRVYLACTPYMATEYLDKHANARNVHHWDPEVLNNKLRRFGFGLLLVMFSSSKDFHVEELIRPRTNTPNANKMKELLAELDKRASLM